jgi:hypothetical protein
MSPSIIIIILNTTRTIDFCKTFAKKKKKRAKCYWRSGHLISKVCVIKRKRKKREKTLERDQET